MTIERDHRETNGSMKLAADRTERPLTPQPYYGHQIDLRPASVTNPAIDHLGRVWNARTLALLFCAAGLGAAVVYLVLKTPLFRATATFEVTVAEPMLNVGGEMRASAGYVPDAAHIQTHILQLSSETFRNRVAERLKQELLEPELPPTVDWFGGVREWLGWQWKDPKAFADFAAAVAARTVAATQIRGSRVVELRCDSPSPKVAAMFLNLLIDEYVKANYSERSKGTQEVGKWVSSEAAEAMKKLRDSELKLQDYAKKNGIFLLGDRDSLSQDKLRQLQSEYSTAQSERRQKESRLQMAQSQQAESLPEFLSDGTLQSLQAKLQDLKREMANLTAVYTPNSEKYQLAANQIRETESIIEQERRRVVERIKNDYDAARRRQNMTSSAYHGQVGVVTKQRLKMIQYDMLKREVENNQALYTNLLQQQNQTRLATTLVSEVPARQIRVLDIAEPPVTPVQPNPRTAVMAGLGGGFLLINLLVFVRHCYEGPRVRHPGDASALLVVRELGVVPSAPLQIERGQQSLIQDDAGVPYIQQMKMKESMRMVLASLMGAATRSHRSRVFLITSPNAGEGKSTITSNLGMAVPSGSNLATLLIDADYYRPQLHELFRKKNSSGWADLIASPNVPTLAEISRSIQPTNIKNLSLLVAGSSIDPHLMNPARVRQLLAMLRAHYQLIFIDVPPMLQIADARMIATETDGVVLVLRSGVTPAESALVASKLLAEDGANLIGTILNDFNLSHPGARKYVPYAYERTAS